MTHEHREPAGLAAPVASSAERLRGIAAYIGPQDLIDLLPGVVFVHVCHGIECPGFDMFVSGRCEELTGYTVEDWLGTRQFWRDVLVHPDDRTQVIAALTDYRDGAAEAEFRIVRKDGTIRWVHDRISVIGHDPVGDKITLGVIVDITDRKQSEAMVRDSERRLRKLLDALPDAFASYDRDLRLTYFNPATREVIPYLNEHSLGQRLPAIVPTFEGSVFEERFAAAAAGTSQAFTAYSASVGGWLDVRAYSDGDGGLGVLYRDVTAERQSAKLRTQLSLALEQTQDIVAVIALDGEVTLVNAAWEAVTGRPPAAILGHRLARLLPREQRQATAAAVTAALAARGYWTGALDIRRAGGAAIALDVWIRPSRPSPDAPAESYVVIARDVTRERALEAQLAHAQRVELIGRLASSVAHETNNVLQAVMGFSTLAERQTARGESPADALARIGRAAGRGRDLVRSLLAFGRPAAMTLRVFDAVEELRQLSPTLRQLAGDQVALTVEGDGPLAIEFDRQRFEQVIINLVVNAVEASARTIRLAAGPAAIVADDVLAPGSYATLVVEDDGEGFANGLGRELFEPFFTTKVTGSGLGLSISLAAITGRGGTIRAGRAETGHTRFTVYLPLVVDGRPVAGELARQPPGPAAMVPEPGGRTLLVVDDEELVRELFRDVLAEAGYQVLTAADGAAALAVHEQAGSIDGLVSDLAMPNMGGVELARQLRQRQPDLPILFVSAFAESAERLPGPLLAKPHEPEELVAAVGRLLATAATSGARRR